MKIALIGDYDAAWSVPISPCADGEAVIAAIEQARRGEVPFLGRCAGYQPALLEYARHEPGLEAAASSEHEPGAAMPVIDALGCSLIDVGESVRFERGARLAEIYGATRASETCHCNLVLNPDYLPAFEGSALEFSCRDRDGRPRGFGLDGHRFFFGTAYQPERRALEEKSHPVVAAFPSAAL